MLSKKELKKFRDAREELHKKDEPYRRAANSDFIIYLLTLMAVAIFIRTFIFEPVQCIGISMYPTLVGGEGMFTEKLTYTVSAPQRDDIIICRYPYHTEKCVKRVIAVPGDRISISDGAIYLNGERLDESAYWSGYIEDSEMPEVTVPERNLFVVGDNRNNSGDSRHVGFIPYWQVKGKVRAVMTPFSQARWI
ncbi:MAG: signal peptidase I [Christensenellales bacterium]|jgi:signal peptidase I